MTTLVKEAFFNFRIKKNVYVFDIFFVIFHFRTSSDDCKLRFAKLPNFLGCFLLKLNKNVKIK